MDDGVRGGRGGGIVTVARHFDRFAAVPGHDEIAAMAPAAISSCLTRDDDTAFAIGDELAAMDATPREAAATFAILAAMLGEACGGRAEARRLAARWTRNYSALIAPSRAVVRRLRDTITLWFARTRCILVG